MTLARFNQKVVLQINLITEDNRARDYHSTFYQIERILTALDIIATTFLLILDFISFVRHDLSYKHNTFTAAWNLGWFQVYLVILVIRLVSQEVICGNILYGRPSY